MFTRVTHLAIVITKFLGRQMPRNFIRKRFIRRAGPTARTKTIAKLIENMKHQSGREPSDAEIARLLACAPAKVARHRKLIGTN